jgi:SAM-dependent methyltransferase
MKMRLLSAVRLIDQDGRWLAPGGPGPRGGRRPWFPFCENSAMPGDRIQRRATFETAADSYHQSRPDYPDALYQELVSAAGLRPGDRLLEVGCGTGKATIPLARRGFRVTCVELGAELAAAARRNLAGFAGAEVVEADFETWRPPAGVSYDLVFAATSWHWIDPAVKYRLAFDALRPGGHLALWSATHVLGPDADPIFARLQDVYDEIGEGMPPGETGPAPGEVPDDRAEIEASGLFGDVIVRQLDWETSYTAAEYIRLLDTFSGHIEMAAWQRERLYGEIRRRLAERPGGRLRRGWGVALQVARRLDRPGA